jgi:hypothetical protein
MGDAEGADGDKTVMVCMISFWYRYFYQKLTLKRAPTDRGLQSMEALYLVCLGRTSHYR